MRALREMSQLLIFSAALLIAAPLSGQPVPTGDEVRVRESKEAAWMTGLYMGRDSTSLELTEAGIERTYALMDLQRVEWKAPKRRVLDVLASAASGAVIGFALEEAVFNPGCLDFRWGSGSECNAHPGRAAIIGATAGIGLALAVDSIWSREWKNVTKYYPPAGSTD